MLSPRIIHFTRSQVFWDCSTVSACESLPDGLPFALSAIATTDRRWRGRLQRKASGQDASKLTVEDSLESFWKTAILNYTSCELTNQTDKTFAIWSVAKLVRDSLDMTDQYGCGLWAKALHEQLAWRVKIVKSGARMDVLQSVFPSWSWASVNAPIQIQDRLVEKRCYTIKNHEGERISFSDFKDKALDRNMQPQFEGSDSLAVCGHLITGRLRKDPNGETTFEYTTATDPHQPSSFNVVLDETLTKALLKLGQFYLLPLAARKTNDEESAYLGSALLLISTYDFRRLAGTKLKIRIIGLAGLYQSDSPEGTDPADRQPRQKILKFDIQALNAFIHRLARQDRDLPSRRGRCYRRIGVVQFDTLAVEQWASIRSTGEEMIWLD
jgi:hypothetical protein